MPACHGHSIDGLVPQFISELLKLRRTQLTEIFRSFNPVEKGVLDVVKIFSLIWRVDRNVSWQTYSVGEMFANSLEALDTFLPPTVAGAQRLEGACAMKTGTNQKRQRLSTSS